MKTNEEVNIIIDKDKKFYTSPKIEAIGDVKDTTRGASGAYSDGANFQFGPPPSDPGNTF